MKVDFHLEIDDEIDMKQTDKERMEALDEQFYVNGYNLDVDQMVRNELTLSLPMKVLCDEDCKGICNKMCIRDSTRATEGDGHRNRENKNMVRPRIHQVREGVFITLDMGTIIR